MAKLVGVKTVIDVRAGSFIRFYENRSRIYKWAVKAMLSTADAVTVEGKAYVDYIKRITDGKVTPHYFPNTIDTSVTMEAGKNPDRRFNIFYFGRITSSKGIDIMIEALQHLDHRFKLFLAGNIAADIDKESILSNNKICYLGNLTPTELEEKKRDMGFFIFPSRWSGEGQSNSLIEAMGAGLVAIASDNGFSKDVVAEAGFILPSDATGKDYAETIARCADNNFEEMSRKSRKQIFDNHNLDKEIEKLIALYNQILKSE